MKKNIFNKLIILFVSIYILFGSNFVVADDPSPEVPPLEDPISSPNPDPTTDPAPAPNENITIRNGDTIIYSGSISLPNDGDVAISGHQINDRSVLALLYAVDQADNTFSISDLNYNDDYKSFLLNCITPTGSAPLCYNWQYTVNGSYPEIGMDKNIINGDKNIYLFFGQPNKVLLSSNSISSSDNLTITTQKYNFEDNTWIPRTGVTVGIVQTNPNDPYNPTEIQTHIVDDNGIVTFSSLLPGSYGAGVKEDYYWPQENFDVVKSESNVSNDSDHSVPGEIFSIDKALSFLLTQQKGDGSFGDSLYTDWVAIGISKAGSNDSLKNSITGYLRKNKLDSSVVTDYERRAMALMSLDVNPYSGTDTNYIKKITDSFDGTQIGDSSLFNDDIFGLIVLNKAGYSKQDKIVSNTVSFIISKQYSDGSWGSVDMTAAAIQALSNFKSISGVDNAISNGESYLKTQQKENGSFGNTSSTSWAIQALSLDNSNSFEINKGINYLTGGQDADGGLEKNLDKDSRVWITAYAIPAVLKLSWNDILNSYNKEEISVVDATPIKEITKVPVLTNNLPEPQLISEKSDETISVVKDTKIVPLKKIQKNHKIIPKFTLIEESSSNPLIARVAINQRHSNFSLVINRVFHKIVSPFVWLWVHLGF